ncbi:MAG TPA: peptide-binding protein, partial [Burkholderiaceae bacterium]
LANVLSELGDTAQVIDQSRQALALNPDLLDAHDNLLFAENYLDLSQSADAAAHTQRAAFYGAIVTRRATPFPHGTAHKDPARQLRIGFVSGDLKAHPVGYFIDNVLQALADRHSDELHLSVYSNTPSVDGVTERIKRHCASWLDVSPLTDAHVAQRIHSDGIDILIDLSGHTAHNRLPVFAWKPAPIQASWLGYFATTGVQEIDYLIADPWSVPESDESDFTETIWRLPETRLCFTPPDAAVAPGTLPALRNGHITFACFNNLGKMGPEVVALWAAILHATPGSRLFLKAKQLGQAAIDERVRSQFAAHGIAPGRLRIEGASPRLQYLAAYNEADIALDPFPYTGGTTTAEALWMGVPVLTLQGRRMIARQGASLLHNAGLGDWIAESRDAYLQQAATRAADLPALSQLRTGLRPQVLASPVFNAPRFAGHFTAAMRGMWRRWCAEPAKV